MKNMTLGQLEAVCHGKLCGRQEAAGREILGVVLDSRKVKKDYLFIAAVGEKADGHDFIEQVMEKGAAGVICEKVPAGEGSGQEAYILVENSFTALQEIAAYYRSHLRLPIVGITGSVGKTSTKEFVAAVLEQKFKVLKTEGNYNNEIGLPLTVLQIRQEHSAAVLEMGINHFGEMHRLSWIAKPDICVMTNIGECHLEFLGSRLGILKAKSEIFDYMNQEGRVCLNGDDDMLSGLEQVYGKAPIRFGLGMENEIYADNIKSCGLFGSTCRIHMGEESFQAEIPLPGEHMVYNALAAAAVGGLLGLSAEEIARGISSVKALSGRNHMIQTEQYRIIDDCYNANPNSMKAGIGMLAEVNTRKIAILGDMGELGEKEKQFHREIGSYAVEQTVDVLVCIGSAAKEMYNAAMEKAKEQKLSTEIYYFTEKKEFLAKRAGIVGRGDTILVKASHFMEFEDIVKALEKD